jgi:septum formation protein
VKYDVIPSTVDETALIEQLGDVPPKKLVQELAAAKAIDVFRSNPDAIVIGADTVVVIDGEILGKPVDTTDAYNMLSRLSGRTHEVFTGIAVIKKDSSQSDAIRTFVKFKPWSAQEISAYIATGDPMDKAGSYGIQNSDISPVESIDGDYYNVMGLPVEDLRTMLKNFFPFLPSSPEQPNFGNS